MVGSLAHWSHGCIAATLGLIAAPDAWATPAQEQEPMPPRTVQAESHGSAVQEPPHGEHGAAQLDDIVVTARHRSENIQQTPFSISALGERQLEAQNIRTSLDLDARSPSLQLRPDNSRLSPFIGMRGVGDIARNPGIDTRAGIYLDGAPLGRSAVINFPIFDVESVEILRGPQGTLFGNNSLTGVIAYTSVKPAFAEEASMRVSGGSRNLFAATGMYNAALSDKAAVRINVSGQHQDGYYRNLEDGRRLGGGTYFAGRAALRLLPDDLTTIDFSADAVATRDNVLLDVGQQSTLSLPRYRVRLNQSPVRERTLFGVNLSVNRDLGGDYKLTMISSYRSEDDDVVFDTDASPANAIMTDLRNRSWSFSQEARIASPAYKYFDFVGGLFFYRQTPSNLFINSFGPAYPLASARGTVERTGGRVDADQYAAFLHGTVRPAAWIDVSAGVRFQRTEKAALKYQSGGVPAGFPDIVDFRAKLARNKLNPMVSVLVKPLTDVSAYALYSTGDRAGGFNIDNLRTTFGIEFEPESVRNYEAGIKTELFDRRVRLNVAAYLMNFSNFQVAQTIVNTSVTPTTFVSVINNAASVRSKGIEADFEAAVLSDLRFTGGIGVNRAYYRSYPNGGGAGIDYTGNTLPEAPRLTAALSGTYDFDLNDRFKGLFSLNGLYRGRTWSSPANNSAPANGDGRYLQESYFLLGGRLALRTADGRRELALFMRNIAGETHADGAFISVTGTKFRTLNEPRSFGVELTFRQ